MMRKLENRSNEMAMQLNRKTNKKVSFHLKQKTEFVFVKRKRMVQHKQNTPDHRKKKNRQNYRRNKKRRKKETTKELMDKINK